MPQKFHIGMMRDALRLYRPEQAFDGRGGNSRTLGDPIAEFSAMVRPMTANEVNAAHVLEQKSSHWVFAYWQDDIRSGDIIRLQDDTEARVTAREEFAPNGNYGRRQFMRVKIEIGGAI